MLLRRKSTGHQNTVENITVLRYNRICGIRNEVSILVDKKEKKYLIDVPDLMNEWDWEKNNELGLNPSKITRFSHCKPHPYWKCKMGHSWSAEVAARSAGNGCPYCSGRYAIEGANDLQSTAPWLAEEWNYEKNNGLLPTQVKKCAGKKVWWRCTTCGHEWSDSVSHRYAQNRHCPKCFGDKHTSFPEQTILFYMQKITTAIGQYKLDNKYEIDVFLPSLNVGIEYDGKAFHNSEKSAEREKNKNTYLLENGITLFRVKECNSALFFDDVSNVIYFKPNYNYHNLDGVVRKLFEIIFREQPSFNVDIKKDAIDIMNNYIVRKKEDSLASQYPDLAKEWHPTANGNLTPENFSVGTSKKVIWLCQLGHDFSASVAHRVSGTGCPYCAGKKVWVNFNDFESRYPELAKEWHPKNNLKPTEITPGYSKKVWWICPLGHEYEADPKHRVNGTGCSVCSGKKIIVGINDFASMRKELLEEWHPTKNLPLLPTQVSKSSGTLVWWLCKVCGHEWSARINKRVSGNGCPECYKQRRKKK